MKIGIDARLWDESGVGRYIRNLVTELAKIDRKNQYVLFLRSSDRVKLGQFPKNWKIVKADIQWHSLKEQLLLPQILKKEKLNLVHFPYFSVPIFCNLPFVVTIHDLIINHFPTGQATTLPTPFYKLKLLGYKFIISQAVKKAEKIITVSNSTKQEIIDHLGVNPEKISVTYEGVEQKNSKLKLPPKARLAKGGKIQNLVRQDASSAYFLYVGNAYPHKNLERLLGVFQKIKSTSQNLKLVLVGREDFFYKKLKEKVRKMGLVEDVVFYGEATDEELSVLYQKTRALIMPSLMEGFGLPAVEAMANKCLVLVSDIPALHEVCGEAAIYFNPDNIKSIADKMGWVINHSNDMNYYSGLIEKGLERSKMFSWEKMARETLKVYQGI